MPGVSARMLEMFRAVGSSRSCSPDVDCGRGRRDDDRFVALSDHHHDRDVGRETGCQLDAAALERAEAVERERDGIHADLKIGDLILTGVVGRGRPHLLDERRACHLDADTGQHRLRRITNDSRYCTILCRGTRRHQHARDCDEDKPYVDGVAHHSSSGKRDEDFIRPSAPRCIRSRPPPVNCHCTERPSPVYRAIPGHEGRPRHRRCTTKNGLPKP